MYNQEELFFWRWEKKSNLDSILSAKNVTTAER